MNLQMPIPRQSRENKAVDDFEEDEAGFGGMEAGFGTHGYWFEK